MSDIATALTQSLASDGQTVPTANLPMGGFKHTNVANAAARNQYAAAGQVQDSSLTWAGTAGGTADAITLTLTPAIAAYAAGQSFTYKSGASANTTSMTVNVNSVGAKAIQKNGSAVAAGDHPANSWFRITYDGAAFQLEQIAPMSLKANVASPSFTGAVDLTAAALAGGTPIVFEGATANSYKTSVVVTDPTAGRTLTVPDADVDLTNVRQGTNTLTGFWRAGTNAEQLAGSLSSVLCTPAGLASSMSLASSGYIKLAGGLIIQWGAASGNVDVSGSGASITATFPLAFPNTCYQVVPGVFTTDSGTARFLGINWTGATTTQATFIVWEGASAVQSSWNVMYIAIGK